MEEENIVRTIKDEDVEWTMEWHKFNSDKPNELRFEHNEALALLLINEVVFIGGFFVNNSNISLNVNCNDLFAWGCADLEPITCQNDIEEVYKAWRKEPFGVSKWCCKRRNEQPQPPVVKMMKEAGAWDVEMEALPENVYEKWSKEHKDVC